MNAKRAFACTVLLSCCGCSEPTPTPTAAQGVANAPQATPVSKPDSLRLSVKSWDQTRQSIAAQHGKIVVLDLWSTWCVPCVREFPNLVKLQRDHPADVVCLGFNLDYSGAVGETPESFRTAISEFLTKQDASFENVISSDAADDVFQRLKLGSIPAVLVYGPDGQLTKRFDNDEGRYGDEGFTYDEHIVPWIEQLLDRNGSPAPRDSDN